MSKLVSKLADRKQKLPSLQRGGLLPLVFNESKSDLVGIWTHDQTEGEQSLDMIENRQITYPI